MYDIVYDVKSDLEPDLGPGEALAYPLRPVFLTTLVDNETTFGFNEIRVHLVTFLSGQITCF